MGARPHPVPIHSHALDHLRYIRETMERAGAFTAVPGWGGVLMGLTAVAAALIAARRSALEWLLVWLSAAAVAFVVGAVSVWRKARAANSPVFSGAGRKFALSFAPPVIVGGLLSTVMYRA